jgi:hypothetical protein
MPSEAVSALRWAEWNNREMTVRSQEGTPQAFWRDLLACVLVVRVRVPTDHSLELAKIENGSRAIRTGAEAPSKRTAMMTREPAIITVNSSRATPGRRIPNSWARP